MYTDTDYTDAIKFAMNYPPDKDIQIEYHYDIYKDIFKFTFIDGYLYSFKLNGFFVRSCLKWEGIKKWIQ